MLGHFYPPPPTFIGGAQPYAPRLGLPQSGPVPQAPPIRGAIALATFGLLIAAWRPPHFYAQGSSRIAPLIPAAAVASNPPPVVQAVRGIITASWLCDPFVAVELCSIAPLLADVPPVPSGINLRTVVESWSAKPNLPPNSADFAPILPIVNDPPRRTGVNVSTLLASWIPPFVASQGYADIAPIVPVGVAPDQPPVPSGVTWKLLRESWTPPFIASQGYGDIAPIVPATATPDAPPVQSGVIGKLLVSSWGARWQWLPEGAQIAPLLPAPQADAPPSQNWTWLRTTLRAWELPASAVLAGRYTQQPIVDNPPPSSRVTLNLIASRWVPAPWWPLPSFVPSIPPEPPISLSATSGQTARVYGPITITVHGPSDTTVNG